VSIRVRVYVCSYFSKFSQHQHQHRFICRAQTAVPHPRPQPIRNFDRRAAAGDFATVVGVRRGSSWVRGYMALAVLQAYITS